MKKELTQTEKIKIANILERTNAGSLDFITMMIEMNQLGIKPTEESTEYHFKWEYIKPQIKSVLYGERFSPEGEKYPLFSKFLMDKIWKFESEVISPWFIKAFKIVSKEIDNMELDWDSCYNHDFDKFTGFVCDQMIEILENNNIPTHMFGFMSEEDEDEEDVDNLSTTETE